MADRPAPPVVPEPVVRYPGRGVRITTFTTGWVAVRTAHRDFAGPDALAMPVLLAGRRWTPWLPINAFLVEHPERTLLVDTGEAADRPAGHFGCGSAAQEGFYRRFLRLSVPPEAEVGRQLRRFGVAPEEIPTVLLTHLHSDHTGNLGALPRAEVLTGQGALSRHRGATGCRLPAGRTREVGWFDEPVGPWRSSWPLTSDGLLRSVPLPGHAPGHQGLVVVADRTVVIAGDAAFDVGQVARRTVPGIATDRTANRQTFAALTRVLSDGGDVLFSHAPTAPEETVDRTGWR